MMLPAQADDASSQLKQLPTPDLVTVSFWLEVPGKTHFSSEEKVRLYYKIKINDLAENSPVYFSLINISPSGTMSVLLNNVPVEPGRIYALPKLQTTWASGEMVKMTSRLDLQSGREYFKALVTTTPINSWPEFLGVTTETNKRGLQRVILLGSQALTVEVD
ncbi:hypothetical protein PN36_22910 [Candidatus Thiomargarita nelsonii]|uniref:DUF4384 domain-containing protein n=1 Tax=Candidatus Thiomargarita nelsonii TaxID=1003181 RepID=A0A0A6PFS2_9GAMM|nr:hypothetical protein PN36_22910 [Candidatus Thiomargarita nelsonii]